MKNPALIILVLVSASIVLSGCLGPLPDQKKENASANNTYNNTHPPVLSRIIRFDKSAYSSDAGSSFEVRVSVRDQDGNPMSDTNVMIDAIAEDLQDSFTTVQSGRGVFRTNVTLSYSGSYKLVATDLQTNKTTTAEATISPGSAEDVRLYASNPRLSRTGDISTIRAWAVDRFGNVANVSTDAFDITTSLGIIGGFSKDSDGRFRALLASQEIGRAVVNASLLARPAWTDRMAEEGESFELSRYTITLELIEKEVSGYATTFNALVKVSRGTDEDTQIVSGDDTIGFLGREVSVRVEQVQFKEKPEKSRAKLLVSVGGELLLSKSVPVDFPLVFADAPKYAAYDPANGSREFNASVYFYVPYGKTLGSYDFTLSFDRSVLSLDQQGVRDGDAADGFNGSHAEFGPGFVRFAQSYDLSTGTQKRLIRLSILSFKILAEGNAMLEARLADGSPDAVQDEYGVSIFAEQDFAGARLGDFIWAGEHVVTKPKPLKTTCITIWNVAGAVTENEAAADVLALSSLFSSLVEKSCPHFMFYYNWNEISEAEWNAVIDTDFDGNLRETGSRPTVEERSLFGHKEYNCINVYYVPGIETGRHSGYTIGPKLPPENWHDVEIVINAQKKTGTTLAHEVTHAFGLTHDEYELNATTRQYEDKKDPATGESVRISDADNLMHPQAQVYKYALTDEQCGALAQKDP